MSEVPLYFRPSAIFLTSGLDRAATIPHIGLRRVFSPDLRDFPSPYPQDNPYADTVLPSVGSMHHPIPGY